MYGNLCGTTTDEALQFKSEFSIILFHRPLKHEKLLFVLVPPKNFHYGLDKGHVYIITIADGIMILHLH